MADEVETFFKAKKKVAAKKLGAQTPDSLGRHLELAVQEQENMELAEEEWKTTMADRIVEPSNEVDSEWIDVDENPEFDLPGLKNLDIDNGDVDVDELDDNVDCNVKQKAWNFEGADDAVVVDSDKELTSKKNDEPDVYVPPSLKIIAASRMTKDVNLTSADEFPSLSAAEHIGKAMVDRKKKTAPVTKAYTPPSQSNAWSRRMTEAKDVTPQHVHQVSDFITSALRKTHEEVEEKSTPNRYVPPHLRK